MSPELQKDFQKAAKALVRLENAASQPM